jgi:hypothetical protein
MSQAVLNIKIGHTHHPNFLVASIDSFFCKTYKSYMTSGQCYEGIIFLIALPFSFILCSRSGKAIYAAQYKKNSHWGTLSIELTKASTLTHLPPPPPQLRCFFRCRTLTSRPAPIFFTNICCATAPSKWTFSFTFF